MRRRRPGRGSGSCSGAPTAKGPGPCDSTEPMSRSARTGRVTSRYPAPPRISCSSCGSGLVRSGSVCAARSPCSATTSSWSRPCSRGEAPDQAGALGWASVPGRPRGSGCRFCSPWSRTSQRRRPCLGRRRWAERGGSGTMSPPRRTTAKAGRATLAAADPAWPGLGTQTVELDGDPVPLGEVVSVDHGGCPFGPGGDARGLVPHQGRLDGGRLASVKSPVASPVRSPVTGERVRWAAAATPVTMRAMAGRGLQQASLLLGRDTECAAIGRLLEDARAGIGGALVVRGEAGIGKSALLDYARQRAAPMTVLSAVGVEAESDLAFAGLHELLRSVLGYLAELPGTQSQALAGALGLAPSTHADRLLISAAVLGLLAAAAEDAPVLVVVDDAQWVDRPSADALTFTARRLRAERLAILFGAREGEASRFEGAGLPELTLDGIGQEHAAAILAASARQAAPGVRDRLLAEAEGNPLALLELPDGLSADQLRGVVPLPEAVPLTARLEGVFRQQISRQPPAVQTALLIAAADNTGNAPAVLRAAAALQLPAGSLDPAEKADLIRVTGARITFRHPLVRSALYQAATLSERQRVHAALADALSGEENTDRRVWHQAMATLTGDEEVAAALEASARRAQLRAGHASAATAFLRAAELSTDGS